MPISALVFLFPAKRHTICFFFESNAFQRKRIYNLTIDRRMQMKLLLVDDEVRLVEALAHTLKKHGYVVDFATDGDIAWEMASSDEYDLIILDRMLPGRDGLSILRDLRTQGISTPILFLTARDTFQDRVEGLDAGADDYLVKPFSKDEFLARIRALLRRRGKELASPIITACGLRLDVTSGKEAMSDRSITLTAKETLLLELLMRNYGRIVTKQTILSKVWNYNAEIEMANVDLYIHYLRKKLGTQCIQTVRGIGYCIREEKHVP
jgi:DNA-binding response OmpR family regulator